MRAHEESVRPLGETDPPPASPAAVFERYRQAIEDELRETLQGRELAFYDMLRYHLGLDGQASGAGKALRPMLCLLVCEALGGSWRDALPAATSIELIHNFSLIHDDIQDGDTERRHRPALWSLWGLAQGINAGDAMFCLATLALSRLHGHFQDAVVIDAIKTVQEATGEMIEGQYLDVSYEALPEISTEQYLEMIRRKTGALLRVSIEVGAMLADAGMPLRLRCRRLGEAVGRLFQIRDDLLGVWGVSEMTGKPVGSDIRRRKKSMPIVVAMSQAGPTERNELLALYRRDPMSQTDVERVLELFDHLGVRAKVEHVAAEAHEMAISLAAGINFGERGRRELLAIVDFLLSREY
ncbi:MAG: polyprenyl synthetase family protein [Chloroflexota bacterium]|nr:polyprenyl synthetase family protein [Chloroflexota bacterium]